MKLIRRAVTTQTINQRKASRPTRLYLFYDQISGTAHFHVEAGPEGELPVDHAAGLLAMHCLVRGQSPSDYIVMVPAAPESLNGLEEKAKLLLQAGHKVKSAVKLTRREEEVLDGILRSLANKEIASELNLSERTVKFHVSSLLAKNKVRSRMELVREAGRHPMQSLSPAVGAPTAPAQPSFTENGELFSSPITPAKVLPLASSPRWTA